MNELKFNKDTYRKKVSKLTREQLLEALVREAELRFKYQLAAEKKK